MGPRPAPVVVRCGRADRRDRSDDRHHPRDFTVTPLATGVCAAWSQRVSCHRLRMLRPSVSGSAGPRSPRSRRPRWPVPSSPPPVPRPVPRRRDGPLGGLSARRGPHRPGRRDVADHRGVRQDRWITVVPGGPARPAGTVRPARRTGPVGGVVQHPQRGQRRHRHRRGGRRTGHRQRRPAEHPGDQRRHRRTGQRPPAPPGAARTAASGHPTARTGRTAASARRPPRAASAGCPAGPARSPSRPAARPGRPVPSPRAVRNRPRLPCSASGRRRSSDGETDGDGEPGDRRPGEPGERQPATGADRGGDAHPGGHARSRRPGRRPGTGCRP